MNIEALLLSARLALSVFCDSFRSGGAARVLAGLFAMAVEILVRGGCGVAAGAPTDRVGILHAAGDGAAWGTRKLWSAAFGHGLAFTFAGLVIASVLYSLPFAVQPLIASFETIDRKTAGCFRGAGRGAIAHVFSRRSAFVHPRRHKPRWC